MVWVVRPRGAKFEHQKVYEGNYDNFSIKLRHGGKFVGKDVICYERELVDFVDHVDKDMFSLEELKQMASEMGVEGTLKL